MLQPNEYYGDAHMQLWKRDPLQKDGRTVIHTPSHANGVHQFYQPQTYRWTQGEAQTKVEIVGKEKVPSLPVCTTKGCSVVPYSKPTNNNPSSSFAPPAPLGVVKNVGNVLEFIGNVRKCETPKGVILFVTTDNKTFNDLETATNRQTMIDKGYPMYMIDSVK